MMPSRMPPWARSAAALPLFSTVVFLIAPLELAPLVHAQEPPLVWSDLYDGGVGQHDEGVAVLFAADGHPVVGGVRTAAGGQLQILIRKLDRQDGAALWTRISSDPNANNLHLTDMLLDHRGDLLVAGYLSSCAG